MAQDSTHYDAVIIDLETKRDQLNAMIETLKQMKSVGLPSMGMPVSSAPSVITEADIPHDAFFNLTIPDAAKKYLSIVKKTKPHPELCDALLNGGFKTSASSFREVVRATLGRNPEFVRVNGQWGLKEWYGKRGKRKSRRTSASSNAEEQLSAIEANDGPDDAENEELGEEKAEA